MVTDNSSNFFLLLGSRSPASSLNAIHSSETALNCRSDSSIRLVRLCLAYSFGSVPSAINACCSLHCLASAGVTRSVP